MKHSSVIHRAARLRSKPIADATRKLFTSDDDRGRSPAMALAVLALTVGLVPDAAQAACSTTAGASLQADAGSTCVASGGYSGAGAPPGAGALTALTGGVINATGALTLPIVQSPLTGAFAIGAGSQINLQAGATISNVSADSAGNVGLQATGGGAITVSGPLTVRLPGAPGNHGVFVQDSGSRITLNGTVDITMGSSASYSPGMHARADSALVVNGDVTIHTAGDSRSDAIAADTASRVTLNGALNLTTTGLQAAGLKVVSAATIDYSGSASFNVVGLNGSGIRAVTGGVVNAGTSSTTVINVTGVNGAGISVRELGSQVNLAGAVRIDVGAGTQADTPSGNLESYAAGLLADQGGAITATGTLQLSTTDATSYGALLMQDDASIGATGGGSLRTAGVALRFLAGANQTARFDGFAIGNSAGDLIQVDAATGTSALALTNSTATAAAGSRLLSVSGGSTFTLGADRSSLSGNIGADASSAVSVNLRNASSLTGVIDRATLNIDATSGWTLTGSSTLSGLTLAGRVTFQAPSASFVPRTLTVNGDWVGQGGTVQLNAALGGSDSPADRIVISGGAASGRTTLQVRNADGLGAATTGDGILLVEAVNGATTTAQSSKDAFALYGGHVDAGAYEYRLYAADAVGAGENWYLRSAYRAEVPLATALPAQLRESNLAMLGNLHNRRGDESGDSAGANRHAWARAVYRDLDIRQGGSVDAHSLGHVSGMQAGTDLLADGNWRAGLYVGFLDGAADVSGNAHGTIGRVGSSALQSRYVGGYATWAEASGLYADAVLQADHHRYSLQPDDSPQASGQARGFAVSIEVGKSFPLNESWTIEPQAQLIHQQLHVDDVQISGANIQQHAASGTIGRLGVRVKDSLRSAAGLFQPYARVNVYSASAGTDFTDFVASAATARVESASGYRSVELAAGFTLALTPRADLYGELGRSFSAGGDVELKSSVQGSVGLRMHW
ncbi:MAG: autotransporter outer membrane beta-barrel domain-containing protein [Burkholderiales bacterium]